MASGCPEFELEKVTQKFRFGSTQNTR